MNEGLFDIFIDSGAAVSTPTCGPCLGGHMGILAKGERAVATTNRNFVGRMGHPESEVYLASPASSCSFSNCRQESPHPRTCRSDHRSLAKGIPVVAGFHTRPQKSISVGAIIDRPPLINQGGLLYEGSGKSN